MRQGGGTYLNSSSSTIKSPNLKDTSKNISLNETFSSTVKLVKWFFFLISLSLSLFHIVKILWNSKVFVNHFFFQTELPNAPCLDCKDIVSPAVSTFFCHYCFLLHIFQYFWITFFVSLKLLFQFFTQFFFLSQLFENCISIRLYL